MTSFQLLRHRRNEAQAFLYAFDLLELNGTDLGDEHPEGAVVFQHACQMGLRRYRFEAPGIALSIWQVAGLAKVQEFGCAGGEA